MKVTYLVSQKQADGSTVLAVSTKEEVQEIMKLNRGLPIERRRNFIADFINDGNELDCVIYEAPLDKYREHCKEHIASERNRKFKKKYRHFSLSNGVTNGDDDSEYESIPDDFDLEREVLSQVWIDDLKIKLATWKPWGLDMLNVYLSGNKLKSTSALSEKYGVSEQVIRKYKRQFEQFVRDYAQTM